MVKGDGSGSCRSDRTELEFDRPLLFLEARTDTQGVALDDKHGTGKDE
jgi:hypothetical protein